MTFSRLLNSHTCSIARTKATTGIKRSYVTVVTGVRCTIQPLSPEAAQSLGMSFGKSYKAFFDTSANIREGDRVTDQLSRVMAVRGLRLLDYGRNQHLEVILEQDMAH